MLQNAGYVRVKEAAEILGVSPNTVRAWGADGKITEHRHPVNNYRLYKRAELERVLRKVERSAGKSAKSRS
jgi:DNA (cytosine-5)-methyltransferase 1